jgi:hypothetical protein
MPPRRLAARLHNVRIAGIERTPPLTSRPTGLMYMAMVCCETLPHRHWCISLARIGMKMVSLPGQVRPQSSDLADPRQHGDLRSVGGSYRTRDMPYIVVPALPPEIRQVTPCPARGHILMTAAVSGSPGLFGEVDRSPPIDRCLSP